MYKKLLSISLVRCLRIFFFFFHFHSCHLYSTVTVVVTVTVYVFHHSTLIRKVFLEFFFCSASFCFLHFFSFIRGSSKWYPDFLLHFYLHAFYFYFIQNCICFVIFFFFCSVAISVFSRIVLLSRTNGMGETNKQKKEESFL